MFWKEAIVVETFVMILVWMYTKVFFLSFEKFSMFESWILKLCYEVYFENSKDVLQAFDQVTKSYLPYFTERSFLCF